MLHRCCGRVWNEKYNKETSLTKGPQLSGNNPQFTVESLSKIKIAGLLDVVNSTHRSILGAYVRALSNDAALYAANENKFARLLSGSEVESSELLASVKLIGGSLAHKNENVNNGETGREGAGAYQA